MGQKSFFIVPTHGKRIRTIRIPRWALLVALLVICCGFAGYFIPFNSFTVDVVEQNLKRNIDAQNGRLLSMIRPMRKHIDNLGAEIDNLEEKKHKIAGLSGMIDSVKHIDSLSRKTTASQVGLDELISIVERDHSLFSAVANSNKKAGGAAYLQTIPVIRPVAGKPIYAARFGMIKDPFTGYSKMHNGVDFVAPRGDPVLATANGVVVKVEDSRQWGKRIVINHAYGYSTAYAHLGSVQVCYGRRVLKGDQIGTVGATGITTGVHVHYEIWHNEKAQNPEGNFFPEGMVAGK